MRLSNLSCSYPQYSSTTEKHKYYVATVHTSRILSPGWILPSLAAAPLGFTVVTKIPGSSPTWMLSKPPLMLNPKPARRM